MKYMAGTVGFTFMNKQAHTLLRRGIALDQDLWVVGSESTTKHFASRLKGMRFRVRREPHRRVQDDKGN
jgi:hypothetical protein